MAIDPKKEQFKPYRTFTMNHEGAIEPMNVWRQQARRLLMLADGDPKVDDDNGTVDPVAWAVLQVGVCTVEAIHWGADMIAKAIKTEASVATSDDLKDQLAKARAKGKKRNPKSDEQKRAEKVRKAARAAVAS